MNAGKKSARRFVASQGYLSRDTVCASCLHRLSHASRRHAATASAAIDSPLDQQSLPNTSHIPPVSAKAPQKAFALFASTVLSRPPLLTRELSGFEKAYYLYQRRLNERLALPFSRYFYYKKGTPGDEEWKRKAKSRQTPARDIGVYNAYGPEGWNDEVLVGDKLAEPGTQVEALIRDAEGKSIVDDKLVGDQDTGGEAVSGDAKVGEGVRKELSKIEVERPAARLTEADRTNNVKSLSRKLDRSLYLLVKNKEGRWRFPADRVYGRENLHQAAERVLIQSCGINMNTWLVGNHPIGHYVFNYAPARNEDGSQPTTPQGTLTKIPPNRLVATSHQELEREEFGEKVFFMKARIMAGQVEMTKNEYGDQDFQWLVKEEVEKLVTRKYWASIRNMLTER